MHKFWNKLKVRWGIKRDIQVVVILCAFALTGFSTLFVHRQIDNLLGIGPESPLWPKLLVFVVIVLPIFNVLLFIWGNLLGQQKFFKWFFQEKFRLLRKLMPFR